MILLYKDGPSTHCNEVGIASLVSIVFFVYIELIKNIMAVHSY